MGITTINGIINGELFFDTYKWRLEPRSSLALSKRLNELESTRGDLLLAVLPRQLMAIDSLASRRSCSLLSAPLLNFRPVAQG